MQLELDLRHFLAPDCSQLVPAYDRWQAFNYANPTVIVELTDMARRLKARGVEHYGIGALWEVLRYQRLVTDDPTSNFKLNDHYRAYYAREIMARNPDLEGFFATRRSAADEHLKGPK